MANLAGVMRRKGSGGNMVRAALQEADHSGPLGMGRTGLLLLEGVGQKGSRF